MMNKNQPLTNVRIFSLGSQLLMLFPAGKRSSDDTPSLGNKEQAKKKPTTRHTTKEAKAAKLAKINKALEIDMSPTPSSPLATSKKHEK